MDKLKRLGEIIEEYKSGNKNYMECLSLIYEIEKADTLNYRIFCDMFDEAVTNI